MGENSNSTRARNDGRGLRQSDRFRFLASPRQRKCGNRAMFADSDEAGRGFRLKAATHSDLKAATIPI